MYKKQVSKCLEAVVELTVSVMNEGICFFLFHHPPFPEKARKMREEKNGEPSKPND